MNPTSSVDSQNPHSTVIDPYYVKGDVFQRDSRYYDQLIGTRRNRTPNKSGFPLDTSTLGNNIRSNVGVNPNNVLSVPITTTSGTIINPPTTAIISQPLPPMITDNQQDQLHRLQEEHQALLNQLQKLTYGGDFGTGDVVVKKNHYIASKTQNATIRDQQMKIRQMQEQVKRNNERLIKYQKASNELEVRMNNIQAIDKEIYRQLKSASGRDKELLERANAALLRGESKENVLRILQQIVVS